MGATVATNSFKTWDGLKIAYHQWGAEGRVAPPVLLHHGFAANAEANWTRTGVVEALLSGRRLVLAIDARGHGHSEKPHDPERFGEQLMARDLACLLDHLGLTAIDLVGYSMGAIVALLFASSDPRVRRLVVGGVGSGVVECGGVDRRAVSNESIIEALSLEDPSTIEQHEARGFRTLADALGADRRALVAQASSIFRGDIPLGRITAPTLLLAGTEDPLAIRPEVLSEAIPEAQLQMVAGNHMACLLDPAFARSTVDFLAIGAGPR
jgi:pimeloyl-ACP methyl ester carboxylesterase